MSDNETDYENDEKYATEFINREGDDDVDEFQFAFICPRCDHQNNLKGDPRKFGKPFGCLECNWVSLLVQEYLEEFATEHYTEAGDDAVRTDGAGETHVNAQRGLWIPPQYRDFDTQLVIRTPRTTIQHYSDGVDAYYGMVTEADFGTVEEVQDPMNPDLAPDRVRFKPQGEDAVELTVALPEQTEVDA